MTNYFLPQFRDALNLCVLESAMWKKLRIQNKYLCENWELRGKKSHSECIGGIFRDLLTNSKLLLVVIHFLFFCLQHLHPIPHFFFVVSSSSLPNDERTNIIQTSWWSVKKSNYFNIFSFSSVIIFLPCLEKRRSFSFWTSKVRRARFWAAIRRKRQMFRQDAEKSM